MDSRLRDTSLHELLAAYSAPSVAPAGISGSALGAAVGAALIVKVARLSERKLAAGPRRERLLALTGKVERLRNMLEDVVDHDAEAYSRLARVKSAHARGLESHESLERAMKTATIIPGAMGRAALICVNLASELVEIAHRPALPDLAMGALMCSAAAEASLLAMRRNLEEVSDEAFRGKILGQMRFFENRTQTIDRILSALKHG